MIAVTFAAHAASVHLVRIRIRAKLIDHNPTGLGCVFKTPQKKQNLPS